MTGPGSDLPTTAEVEALLARPATLPSLGADGQMGGVRSNITRAEYADAIERCLEYIRAGDIFQVVFSQRFQFDFGGDPFDIYRVLRTVNPSPYMFHIEQDGLQVLGASPEILVRVQDSTLEVRPIAGTRARGATPDEDERLADDPAVERLAQVLFGDGAQAELARWRAQFRTGDPQSILQV